MPQRSATLSAHGASSRLDHPLRTNVAMRYHLHPGEDIDMPSLFFHPFGKINYHLHGCYAIRINAVVESYAGKVTVNVPFVEVISPPKSSTASAASPAWSSL